MKRWAVVVAAVLAMAGTAQAQQLTPEEQERLDTFFEQEEIKLNAMCVAWVRKAEPTFQAFYGDGTDGAGMKHRSWGSEYGQFLFSKCMAESARARAEQLAKFWQQQQGRPVKPTGPSL